MINKGSEWHRWEPHIHAPGTLMNDQFKGPTAWDDYVGALENAVPSISAIAVTDYYVTETYEQLLKYKEAGRLSNVELIFPNLELRLDVATAKGGFVNLHLFVNPDDPNHVSEIQRFLSRLHFTFNGDQFDCTRNDLIRLGKAVDPNIIEEKAALSHGALQFKVNFESLRNAFAKNDWSKKNVLIAVAGSRGDGTSGVRGAADQAIRREIESFAHVIFASSPAQREFWLGQRSDSREQIISNYGGLKPCLHGSDAHDPGRVAAPVGNRYSWIKGGLEFDSLRQACIDPEGRAFVGSEPPSSAIQSQIVSEVVIQDASWMQTPIIPLNSGLVAVIGARGSGKTALADVIAAGCDAITPDSWSDDGNTSPSFLARAKPLIGTASVSLSWGNGTQTAQTLDGRDANGYLSFPKARYLSQQFVEELCSSTGLADGLIEEIERVVFEAHPLSDRDGATEFSEFREQKTSRHQQTRARESAAISDMSERVATELEKETLVLAYSKQVTQKNALLSNLESDLAKLVTKGTKEQVARHAAIEQAAQKLRSKVDGFSEQRRAFFAMQDEVESVRKTRAPELLRQTQERHNQSGLSDQQWEDFLLIHKGNVDESLKGYISWADNQISDLKGPTCQISDPLMPLIEESVDLNTLTLFVLDAELSRLEAIFSEDKLTTDQYKNLTKRIREEKSALESLKAKLKDAEGAQQRRRDLQAERELTYERVFESVINEQETLTALHAPLMEKLRESSGTLSRLEFHVQRVVDVSKWGEFAETNLLDLRKTGDFMGRGALTKLARDMLEPVWKEGSAGEIRTAMTQFIAAYMENILAHAPFSSNQRSEYKDWLRQFAHWLFGTDHITVQYEIRYDGIDIRKLSPGTRGIVLLLLYLALDDTDDRPLIIDQPEENLDPKSVNDELVPLFIAAKAKRQVIMVTHNANLVVNTDADQVVIAEAGPHEAGGLPPITYRAGGLENSIIRDEVCKILEGGEIAFRDRARRLRVILER